MLVRRIHSFFTQAAIKTVTREKLYPLNKNTFHATFLVRIRPILGRFSHMRMNLKKMMKAATYSIIAAIDFSLLLLPENFQMNKEHMYVVGIMNVQMYWNVLFPLFPFAIW